MTDKKNAPDTSHEDGESEYKDPSDAQAEDSNQDEDSRPEKKPVSFFAMDYDEDSSYEEESEVSYPEDTMDQTMVLSLDQNPWPETMDALKELRGEKERLQEELEKVAAERDENKNRMLRVAADMENFRRRAQREKDELRKYGIDKVVAELIPAVDNLERALQHAGEDADTTSIVDGVRMVYRQILSALEKHGVKGFVSKGEAFDPQRHEAIQQIETSEFPTGQVLEEYQKGYFLHDRLLRPALVAVAKNVQTPHVEPSADPHDEAEHGGHMHDSELAMDTDEHSDRDQDGALSRDSEGDSALH